MDTQSNVQSNLHRYLSYPSQVVFKSCKLIPVMLGGIVIQRKQYTVLEFLASGLLSLGLAVFTLADVSVRGDLGCTAHSDCSTSPCAAHTHARAHTPFGTHPTPLHTSLATHATPLHTLLATHHNQDGLLSVPFAIPFTRSSSFEGSSS